MSHSYVTKKTCNCKISPNKKQRKLMADLMVQQNHANENKVNMNTLILSFVREVRELFPLLNKSHHSDDIITDLSLFSENAQHYPVVSFDFFDTLIIREVEPERVLAKVAEISCDILSKALQTNISEKYYTELRISVERELRQKSYKMEQKDHETTHRLIVNGILDYLGIEDDVLLMQLLTAEAALEFDTIRLNSGAKELLSMLKNLGKKIIVVSDMYLTANDLKCMAEILGIDEFISQYYVSGDIGYAKYTGMLFKHVLQAESISADEIIHIGDNYHSDYIAASRVGVKSFWFFQKKNLSRRRAIRKNTKFRTNDFIFRQINLYCKDVENPSALTCSLFNTFAPMVFAHAYKNIKDSIKLGITNFYFLAREGIAYKIVYDLLLNHHPEFSGLKFNTRILYISRASSVCARYTNVNDIPNIIASVYERFGVLSYENLLRTWSVSESDLTDSPRVTPCIMHEKDVYLLFSSKEFATSFDFYMQKQKNALFGYLKQEGVFDAPCFLVDIGWAGTIQKNIMRLKPDAEIFGSYTGTNTRFGIHGLKGYLFDDKDINTKLIVKTAPLIEEMLSCNSINSTLGYQLKGDTYVPVFSPGSMEPSLIEQRRNEVFNSFINVFLRLTRDFAMSSDELVSYAKSQVYKFVAYPEHRFMREISQVDFQYNWGDTEYYKIIKKIKKRHLLMPRKLYQEVLTSPWCFATLKASGLNMLNPVARFAAKCDTDILRKIISRLKFLGIS